MSCSPPLADVGREVLAGEGRAGSDEVDGASITICPPSWPALGPRSMI
jgi:hypothetical protein